MRVMKTYRILKDGQTKLVVPGRILTDGTLRCTDKDTPIVLTAECTARGLDPRKVQAAAAPAECLGRLGLNAGNVEIVEEEAYQAAQLAKREAEKTPAERDWDATVIPAQIALDRAESANYYDPARIISARNALGYAREQWAAKWPDAAAAKADKARAEREAHEAEIRSRPGYRAAMEGRD